MRFYSKANLTIAQSLSPIIIPIGFPTNETIIVWFGSKTVPCLSILRQTYRYVIVFESCNDRIEIINKSSPMSICNCIFIIHDKFENTNMIKTTINQISELKQNNAIYIYGEDENILIDHRLKSRISNEKQLIEQINSNIKKLDQSKRKSIDFDREDVRIEIHENTFNAYFSSLKNLPVQITKEQIDDVDKNRNFSWAADFIFSNMKISLLENEINVSTDVINMNFTATAKITLTSVNIPLYATNFQIHPGLSAEFLINGNAAISFNLKTNKFNTKIFKAIANKLKLFDLITLQNKDLSKWISIPEFNGPVNIAQSISIQRLRTTMNRNISTNISIVNFRMECQHQRIILCFKLNYHSSATKTIAE